MQNITKQQRCTILAALRFYQQAGLADDPSKRSDEIHDIATDHEQDISLDTAGIYDLYKTIEAQEANPVRKFVAQIARMKKEGEYYTSDGVLVENPTLEEEKTLDIYEPDGNDDEIDALYSLISTARELVDTHGIPPCADED